MPYYVYILTNRHHTVLYTGVTNDIERRLREHREGRGSRFTKRYNVSELVYVEEHQRPQDAIDREKQIKAGSRQKKVDLIEGMKHGGTWPESGSVDHHASERSSHREE